MTISPRIVEGIKSMKNEGYTNEEIAKKYKISVRTVGKKLKEPTKVEPVQNQQHSTIGETTDNLDEQLRIMEVRPKVEKKLCEMWCSLDENDESVLVEQLEYLWNKLQNAVGLKEIEKIEELIAEGSRLSQNFLAAVKRWKEKVEREEEEAKKDNFAPKKCHRCEKMNPPTGKFCSRCGAPLDQKTAMEVEEKRKEMDNIMTILLKDLLKDPEIQDRIENKLEQIKVESHSR